MSAKNLIKSVKAQSRQYLTGDLTQSVDYVYHNIELKHARAALWLSTHKQMDLNAYNLHDLILNYDSMKMLADTGEAFEIADLAGIPQGAFNPVHLLSYLHGETR